jgi:hypothetical protein
MNILGKITPEIYTRQNFAYERGVYWHNLIKHSINGGNIITCKATRKFAQARKIYIHYANVFQKRRGLPLTKV